jgi:hypothetical protein
MDEAKGRFNGAPEHERRELHAEEPMVY